MFATVWVWLVTVKREQLNLAINFESVPKLLAILKYIVVCS